MIGSLRGTINRKADRFLIIETGGVGYKAFVTDRILNQVAVDEEMFLFTHTIIRENILDIYGFISEEELDFFEMLIGVSGIGPKSALSIINLTTINTLKDAISTGDITHLTKVSGIGKKIAEKIVLELGGKLSVTKEDTLHLKEEIDTIEALKALGYSQKEAQETVKKIPPSLSSTNEKLKEALKILSS